MRNLYRSAAALAVTAVLLTSCSNSDSPLTANDPAEHAASDVVAASTPPERAGLGESLVLVVGGEFSSREAADAANGSFGEMQGFYVVPATDFEYIAAYRRITPVIAEIDCSKGRGSVSVDRAAGRTRWAIDTACMAAESEAFPGSARVMVDSQISVDESCERPAGCFAESKKVLGEDLKFSDGSWLLVTAFRTKAGAEDFIDMATAYGFGDLAAVRVRRAHDSGAIGLGQEAAPDGSGALETPLENQQAYQ